MTVASAQEFRVGEIIGQSFQTTVRNIVPFGILAIIAVVIIVIIFLIVGGIFGLSLPTTPGAMETEMQAPGVGFFIGLIVVGLLTFAVYMGVMAAITYGTVQDLRGQPVGVGGLLQSAINLVMPVLGTFIVLLGVFLLAAIVAIILNFIPLLGALASIALFVFLYIIFWVVIPVAVVERPGPIASLRRSVDLTKGNRWRILGIILLLILISIGVTIVSLLIAYLGAVLGGIVQAVLNAILGVFGAVLIAVSYYRLRVAKEGVDIADIAKVFD